MAAIFGSGDTWKLVGCKEGVEKFKRQILRFIALKILPLWSRVCYVSLKGFLGFT